MNNNKNTKRVIIREGGGWRTCTWCGKPVEGDNGVVVGFIEGTPIEDYRHLACIEESVEKLQAKTKPSDMRPVMEPAQATPPLPPNVNIHGKSHV